MDLSLSHFVPISWHFHYNLEIPFRNNFVYLLAVFLQCKINFPNVPNANVFFVSLLLIVRHEMVFQCDRMSLMMMFVDVRLYAVINGHSKNDNIFFGFALFFISFSWSNQMWQNFYWFSAWLIDVRCLEIMGRKTERGRNIKRETDTGPNTLPHSHSRETCFMMWMRKRDVKFIWTTLQNRHPDGLYTYYFCSRVLINSFFFLALYIFGLCLSFLFFQSMAAVKPQSILLGERRWQLKRRGKNCF